jgi:hypothetical protein
MSQKRFQYSLRSLLIVTAICAVVFGLLTPTPPDAGFLYTMLRTTAYLILLTIALLVIIWLITRARADDPLSPCQLAAFTNELPAEALVEALAAEGIRAMAVGGYTSGFRAEAPGEVQVVIASKDLSRAKEILEAFENVENSAPFGQGSAETED